MKGIINLSSTEEIECNNLAIKVYGSDYAAVLMQVNSRQVSNR